MKASDSSPSPGTDSAARPFLTDASLHRANRIIPVFLPFAGCPGKCVFCAQDKQSGNPEARGTQDSLTALAKAATDLGGAVADGEHGAELAFYGGTFTALPGAVRKEALDLVRLFMGKGLLSHARCSTRPDALSPSILAELADAKLDLVELGVQSFHDEALTLSRRGYSREQALHGCQQVLDAGLNLGIQLLPGMPGVSPEVFLDDVRLALSLRPALLRFYPCLVPDGTPLAEAWRRGEYAPWSLEQSIASLGQALAWAWEANIPVTRLSVAPEPAFDDSLLAGPRHPALGSSVQAEAMRLTLQKLLADLDGPPQKLFLPRRCQGYIYGQQGKLRPWYESIGLGKGKLLFWDEPFGLLAGL